LEKLAGAVKIGKLVGGVPHPRDEERERPHRTNLGRRQLAGLRGQCDPDRGLERVGSCRLLLYLRVINVEVLEQLVDGIAGQGLLDV
jgi:hypothetical protein